MSSDASAIQETILTFIPIAPTILSVVASSTILYLVIQSGFASSYKRILFGLSVSDIITSVTFALRPFLLPVETSARIWAYGNDATCTALGAFTQLMLATMLYTGVLSLYYLLTIRFGVKESVVARFYEPWMHAVAILFPLTTALAGLSMNAYHEVDIGHGCWIEEYPKGCSQEKGECRGVLVGWLFMGLWSVLVLVVLVTVNIIIYRHVRHILARARQKSSNGATQDDRRTNHVAVQCFLYVAAYVGTFVWITVLKIVESRTSSSSGSYYDARLFPLRFLNALLLPSTGTFNLCVYLRPRYIRTRAQFPTESRLWAVQRALYGETIPTTMLAYDQDEPLPPTQYESKSNLSTAEWCTSKPTLPPAKEPIPPSSEKEATRPSSALTSSSNTCQTALDTEPPS